MSGIRLLGVSKHYGSFAAVDQVDLAVAQGEFVTVLGPSGSGKTTMLMLIAGLTGPSGGRIEIGGRDVTDTPAAKRNVGLVFQSYALFPHMSVFDNVAFPLSVRKVDKATTARKVEEALKLVRLDGFAGRRPSELSGGQQQRVALARAVVFEPDILLLDEPLGALDRKLREELQVELKQLQRTLGVTSILVTHDQEEALSLSDRILVIDRGQVQQVATPEEAYLKPQNRFVAGFLGIANFLDGTLERLGRGTVIRLPDGMRVDCADPGGAAGRRVLGVVRPERVHLDGDGAGVAAQVSEAVYLGQTVRTHLTLANGTPIVAVEPFRGRRYAPGETVRLGWRPEDVWIVAPD